MAQSIYVYGEQNWSMFGGGGGVKTNGKVSQGEVENGTGHTPHQPQYFLMG